MSFQQPTSTTIRQTQFRGKTHTFQVKSVLAPEVGGGLLHLDASDAYVLTTSVDETPSSQHTLPYSQQPDGSWLASGTVNVITNTVTLLSGSVILQDPLGEMLTLPISIEPSLFLDSSVIEFNDTKLGDTIATILNVRQRGVIAPVNLRVEPKHQFVIADAKAPMVTADKMNIMPVFEGTNIIIRYKPNRGGLHKARLVVSTPYDIKTVQLQGQTGGFFNRLQMPKLPPLRLTAPVIPYRGQLMGGLAAVVFAGLLWTSYSILTRSERKIDPAVATRQSLSAYANLPTPVSRTKKAVDFVPESKSTSTLATSTDASAPIKPPSSKALPQPAEQIVLKKPVARSVQPEEPIVAKVYRLKPATSTQTASAQTSTFSADQISDLEKELNGLTPSNKP